LIIKIRSAFRSNSDNQSSGRMLKGRMPVWVLAAVIACMALVITL